MENATSSYWKLKAIDSLEMSNDLPVEERKKIIDSFIDNQEIKDVLVSDNHKFESTDLVLQNYCNKSKNIN